MSHTITAKLNEDARIFQAGESTGFGFRLGERYYDRETQQSEYTNYEGAIFSRNEKQIQFWTDQLKKGAILTVSCDQLKIDSYTADNGTTYLKNQMQNCRMDNVFTLGDSAPSQQSSPAPQQPKPQPQTFGSFNTSPAAPVADPWADYKPSATTNGATIEQVKQKYNGDLQAAITNGHVEMSSDVPF